MVVVKKKMETCTFKLNIGENRILLLTGGGATCRHYAYFFFCFSLRNLCAMLLMVPRSKLVRSEIN